MAAAFRRVMAMGAIYDFLVGTPVGIAGFGAHFLYLSIPAWLVVCARAARRRMSRMELTVFGAFVALVAMEAFQLSVDGAFFKRELWGLQRYFGVFAPLLWLFLAKGAADLWGQRRFPALRPVVRAALCLAALYVLVFENFIPVRKALQNGYGREALTAAAKIAPVIRADYQGPRTQSDCVRTLAEYFQPARPVVYGNFAAAAWAVRGQSEGAYETLTRQGGGGRSRCPYPPDYVFLCLGLEGESDFSVDLAEDEFEFVSGVKGMKTVWGLFRRKPETPR
ncbi:MAG: hypothetical protein ACI4R9_04395 [Kiritimatiellia bacterium]